MADNNLMGSPLAVAVTAAIFSPRVRQVLHGGAVHGLAGVLIAGDGLASFARGVGRGFQEANASTATAAQDSVEQPDTSATETAQEAGETAQEADTKKSSKSRKTAAKAKASPKTGESESR
jgi:Sec-independent protein translocase protein TatA